MFNSFIKILCLCLVLVGCGGGGGGESGGTNDTKQAQALFTQALSYEESGNNSQAFTLYTQAAGLGHSGAQNNLGVMYQNGIATSVDYQKANALFRKSADQNNPFGQYNLGRSYYFGIGVSVDYPVAFRWLSASAEQEHYSAQNLIGEMHENGEGTAQDYDKAILWYKKAADHGSPQGKYNLGRVYQYGISVAKDYDEAYRWYELASQDFHSLSLYKLAIFEMNGWGTPQNNTLAVSHLKQSAEEGYSKAQYLLGRVYYTGKLEEQIVISIDLEESRYWYSKAADQGHTAAKNNLALMYAQGEGGATNHAAAQALLLNIAQDDYIIGQLNLAEMYELGHVSGNDFDEAFAWYTKAETLCDSMSELTDYCAAVKVALGTLYKKGLAVSLDYQTARDYFDEAATVNYPNAFTKIGEMYLEGLGVTQDYSEAKAWFEKAITADYSDPAAEVNLGYLYANGLGVSQDLVEAKNWYNKAAEQKYAPAYTHIGDLESPYSALHWYRQAIAQYSYDPRAFFEIGKLCSAINYYGCTNEDRNKDWYQLAAKAGNLEAIYYLAESKYDRSDFAGAAILYEQAALRNHVDSALKIADMYSRGIGVSKNEEKSASYYLRIAELGSAEAQYEIAHDYTSGYGVSIDYSLSHYWFEQAHNQGYSAATTELGKLYENGLGVTQDYTQTIKYYLQAALQANQDAQYRLGYMYLNGVGTSVDTVAGRAWLLQAATKGHQAAQALTYSPIDNVYDNGSAIAILRQDGSVITWGSQTEGGDSIAVREQLTQGVKSIHYSDDNGFVALKYDGSVVAWGDQDSTQFASIAAKLTSGTKSIHAGNASFAALKNDGSVITWGISYTGGDSSAVSSKLTSGVEKIITGDWFISAIKTGGELVVWGSVDQASLDPALSSDVTDVASSSRGAVALKSDGTIVTFALDGWADPFPSHIPASELGTINYVLGGLQALAVLNDDGNMLWWNFDTYITPFPSGISKVYTCQLPYCFVAHKPDGTLYTWSSHAGFSNVTQSVATVDNIVTSGRGFAALKSDGSLVSWGYDSTGAGLSYFTDAPTSNVQSIYSNYSSFAAIKNDGSATSWGSDSSDDVNHKLADSVTEVYPSQSGFFATKIDGEVVYWGDIRDSGSENVSVNVDVALNPPV